MSACSQALNSAGFISGKIDDGVDREKLERDRQLADIEDLVSVAGAADEALARMLRKRSREHSRARLAELTG
ncbi:hypothetical protein [Streptomyces sp. NPDC051162]|uniref:hypothetical protein n=1 Tax=unclassified Streptomyces TaxID=2593676 RepID=UPI003415DEBD